MIHSRGLTVCINYMYMPNIQLVGGLFESTTRCTVSPESVDPFSAAGPPRVIVTVFPHSISSLPTIGKIEDGIYPAAAAFR